MWSLSLIFLSAFAFANGQKDLKVANVIIVADTGKLLAAYENNPPSQDFHHPTLLPANQTSNFTFMVTTKDRAVAGQATANLTLKVRLAEPIRFTGISESANMDYSIVVYNITKYKGDELIGKAVFNPIVKGSVEPIKDKFPQVNLNVDHDFWPLETVIKRTGAAIFSVRFGLYNRGKQDKEQKLFGYYEFHATLQATL